MPITGNLRRSIAVVGTGVALLAPAGAAASDRFASRGDEFKVRFQVVSESGKPERVKRFVFRNVVIDCDAGPSPFLTDSAKPHFGPFNVTRKGRFGRVFNPDTQQFEGTVEIRGEFVTKRRVEGTLAIDGDYPENGSSGCTSGELGWTAKLG